MCVSFWVMGDVFGGFEGVVVFYLYNRRCVDQADRLTTLSIGRAF